VKKGTDNFIGIEIDKLTNSINNTISGDSFPTEIALISTIDLNKINKANGWLFNWKAEHKLKDRKVYKLTIIVVRDNGLK
jgi:hypothetical protein